MAHCVFHKSGLTSREFSAVLDAIQEYGRSWRTESLTSPGMQPLIERIGVTGVQEIVLNTLALRLERSATSSRGMFAGV